MFNLISVNELAILKQKRECSIVDIRDSEDYIKGHIPEAVNISDFFYYLSASTPEGVEQIEKDFQQILNNNGIRNKDAVIIYEEEMDKRYGGSCRGAFIMKFLGHEDVYVLHGGYSAWKNAGFDISDKPANPVKTSYKININRTLFVDYQEMLRAIANPDIFILDNRDREEWIGISSSPYGADYSPRKGRIPGAHWIEWYNFMEDKDGIPMFKSDDDIRKIAKQYGIHSGMEIIIYCFKGSRAANTLLALHKAGFGQARVYFASWYEWAAKPELPVDDSIIG